jgi:hypothetical protein
MLSSPNIIKMIKSRIMRWVEDTERKGKWKMNIEFQWKKLGIKYLGRGGVDGRNILPCILMKLCLRIWVGLGRFRTGTLSDVWETVTHLRVSYNAKAKQLSTSQGELSYTKWLGFKILTAVDIIIKSFWNVTTCSLVDVSESLGGTSCFHIYEKVWG